MGVFIVTLGRQTVGAPDARTYPTRMVETHHRESKGTFTVLVSPVPWVFARKVIVRYWNGFKGERHEIFEVIRDSKKDGVLLMSADRHRSDLWKIEHEGIYPLYEFNSSRLTNQHVHPELPAAEFSYNKSSPLDWSNLTQQSKIQLWNTVSLTSTEKSSIAES